MNYAQTVLDFLVISYHHIVAQSLKPQIDTLETQAKTQNVAREAVHHKLKVITDLFVAISGGLKANGFEAKDPQLVELLKSAIGAGASLDPQKVSYTKVEAEELMSRLERIMLDLEINQQCLMRDVQESLFRRDELWTRRMQHIKAIDNICYSRLRLTDQSNR